MTCGDRGWKGGKERAKAGAGRVRARGYMYKAQTSRRVSPSARSVVVVVACVAARSSSPSFGGSFVSRTWPSAPPSELGRGLWSGEPEAEGEARGEMLNPQPAFAFTLCRAAARLLWFVESRRAGGRAGCGRREQERLACLCYAVPLLLACPCLRLLAQVSRPACAAPDLPLPCLVGLFQGSQKRSMQKKGARCGHAQAGTRIGSRPVLSTKESSQALPRRRGER